MDIQSLVRQKIIGNVKIGKTKENGLPQKLGFFNVEEDKVTDKDTVDVFRELYGNEPRRITIRFVTEDFFSIRFKRYTNKKVVCVGNGSKAITIGKDEKGLQKKLEIECLGQDCEQLKLGKCKLKGSLRFIIEGIDAGGLWNLSTTGGESLSNIATEIIAHNKRGENILNVPFEIWLTEKEHMIYGTYYVINIKRKDFKPKLVTNTENIKQLNAGENKTDEVEIKNDKTSNENKEDCSNYLVFKKSMPTIVNNSKFDKIIFEDINGQDVEYILHPKADKKLMDYGSGTVIELVKSTIEMDRNVLCKYSIKQFINDKGEVEQYEDKELKKAV